ncbi:MAG: hypothetical protein WB800_14090, partial [Streptosporangiaceae bacterium]
MTAAGAATDASAAAGVAAATDAAGVAHAGGARRAGAGIHPAGGGIHPAMLLRAAVIIPALVAAVALSAFAWSAARLAPRGVPVG